MWLARPGEARPTRGTLSLKEHVLTLDSEQGAVMIDLATAGRVRRPPGSPVLEIHYSARGEPRIALFYFVEPPPLPGADPAPTARAAWRWASGSRGLRRMAGMGRLRRAGRELKPLIERWVEEVRERAGRRSG